MAASFTPAMVTCSNGITYTVYCTDEELEMIYSGPEAQEQFAAEILDTLTRGTAKFMAQSDVGENLVLRAGQCLTGEAVEEEPETDNSCVSQPVTQQGLPVMWSKPATKLLIELYRRFLPEMNMPTITMKKVWQQISSEMHQKGYIYSHDACSNKWRSLKHTYKSIKNDQNKTGRGTRRWEFFHLMDELLSRDPAIEPVSLSCSTPSSRNNNSTPSSARSGDCVPASLRSSNSAMSVPNEDLDTSSCTSHSSQAACSDGEDMSATSTGPKRNRRKSHPPLWLKDILQEQQKEIELLRKDNEKIQQQSIQMQRQTLDLQQEWVDIQRERNAILKDISAKLTQSTNINL